MRALDTSSIVYAWDNYPVLQFPGLWQWIAAEVANAQLVMSSVAFGEVQHVAPDCHVWLVENKIEQTEMSNEILQDALRIKALLGIEGDDYHPKGVGENDIFIIASARVAGIGLVSNEARQTSLMKTEAKRKIPSVCAMPTVSVDCIDFLEFIVSSGEVF